jgi:hypothetical protein
MIKYKFNVALKAFAIENIFQDKIIFNWLDIFLNLKLRILILELNKNLKFFRF